MKNRHANKCFILSSQKKHDSLVFHFTFMNSKNPNSDKEDLIVLASLVWKRWVWWFGLSHVRYRFGCFLKWWYPQNTPKWSMVVGYHHFRKPPYGKCEFWLIWMEILKSKNITKRMIHACRRSSSPSALVAEYSATYVAWLHFQVARTFDAELSDLCTIELP